MPPRSSWKGFLKLSLVSVPVKAFPAHESSEDIRLNQLHAECHGRVRYRKVCPEHGELANDQIVSGYEYAKGQYVVIDPDEVQKLRKESDKAVAIEGFVPPDAIDPLYLSGRDYFLLPDGVAGERPYALLREGMVEEGVVAVAKVVIAGRTQLVVLRPLGDLLVMSTLSWARQVREPRTFQEELHEQATTDEERKLTRTLIGASRLEEFDLAAFEDDYAKNLRELIRMKIEGEEVVTAPEPEAPKIINLMDALKKSVAEAQSAGRKQAPSAKEPAAAPRKRAKRKKTG